jgi:myo-inositol-1-phosphate synthase
MISKGLKIDPAPGKLGVVLPGMGAVSSTFIAGVEAVKKGLAKPIGSLTQMGTIRLGKRTDGRIPAIKDFVPLASIDDLVFGGWDIFSDNIYQAGVKAGVLERSLLDQIRPELERISPWPAAFDKTYVKKLDGTHIKKAANKMELAEQIQDDIRNFQKRNNLARTVMVWCGSTEIFLKPEAVHQTIESFEQGMKKNDPAIAPSMLYAYAAIKSGIPYANGAPNLSGDIPALMQLAKDRNVPIMGKDFKTGQTLMKTILAPGLKSRLLGLNGWFSTNTHKVRINYYPPRGDNKEGWDNIDIFGWLGYPMQIKVDFLCRDSILAAPLVLDLVIFMDLAQRCGMSGIQEWLSFYFKSPMHAADLYPEHDLFIQLMKLKNTLRFLKGEELITHLGLEYYD